MASINRQREKEKEKKRLLDFFYSVFFFVSIIKLNDAMRNDFIANFFLLFFYLTPPTAFATATLTQIVIRQVCKIFNNSDKNKQKIETLHSPIYTELCRTGLVGRATTKKKWAAKKTTENRLHLN